MKKMLVVLLGFVFLCVVMTTPAMAKDDRPYSRIYWNVSKEFQLIPYGTIGFMTAFGGHDTEFSFPLIGTGVWIGESKSRNFKFGGFSVSGDLVTDDGFHHMNAALSLSFSPMAFRVYECDNYHDPDLYLKLTYSRMWRIDDWSSGSDTVPNHAIGLQLAWIWD